LAEDIRLDRGQLGIKLAPSTVLVADSLKAFRTWITFAGGVLVVAVLYWAQAVLVPVCLSILLTFVLTPPVLWLQRRIGRVAAVIVVVTLVFSGLGVAAWGISRQMGQLTTDLEG
jgi:predicted PurR-regulated permease PerM